MSKTFSQIQFGEIKKQKNQEMHIRVFLCNCCMFWSINGTFCCQQLCSQSWFQNGQWRYSIWLETSSLQSGPWWISTWSLFGTVSDCGWRLRLLVFSLLCVESEVAAPPVGSALCRFMLRSQTLMYCWTLNAGNHCLMAQQTEPRQP